MEHRDGLLICYRLDAGTISSRRGKYFTQISADGSPALQEVPGSCTRTRKHKGNDPNRISLTCVSLQHHIPLELTDSFLDDLLDLGGEWMWNNFVFDTDDSLDWLVTAY